MNMRKANVTYEEVAAYCDREVADGKDPDRFTGRELQDALDCDSGLATIIKLINQWREPFGFLRRRRRLRRGTT